MGQNISNKQSTEKRTRKPSRRYQRHGDEARGETNRHTTRAANI